MENGIYKICLSNNSIKLNNIEFNSHEITKSIDEALNNKANIVSFQSLNLVGNTLGDIIINNTIYNKVLEQLEFIRKYSISKNIIIILSLPLKIENKFYISACPILNGKILGFSLQRKVHKMHKTIYSNPDFKFKRVVINEKSYICSSYLLFNNIKNKDMLINITFDDDLYCSYGLNALSSITFNLGVEENVYSKNEDINDLIKYKSFLTKSYYCYVSSNVGESSSNGILNNRKIVAFDNLKKAENYQNSSLYYNVDLNKSMNLKMNSKYEVDEIKNLKIINFSYSKTDIFFQSKELYLSDIHYDEKALSTIFNIQVLALMSRISFLNLRDVLIGISGGLDSTYALLVIYESFKRLNLDLKGIHAYTLPSLATGDKTKTNAFKLCESLNVSLKSIDIHESFKQHLKDIDHPTDLYDITYENSQARERTQILMDLANKYNGIVIGTGDLSELAQGWCTYNADQMSMFNVNGGITKTFIREYLTYLSIKEKGNNITLSEVLISILNTPISPELIPQSDNKMQKTEDSIGVYEITDYFLYNLIKYHYEPQKIYQLACYTFENIYTEDYIYKTLISFLKRFMINQFKRKASPDTIKTTDVSLNFNDFKIPSDLYYDDFINNIKK